MQSKVLVNASSLMGLPTLKKSLIEEFSVAESKVFNANVKKVLVDLTASPRDDFGKIGLSYHAGESSAAYQATTNARVEEDPTEEYIYMSFVQEDRNEEYIDQGLIKCCFCGE